MTAANSLICQGCGEGYEPREKALPFIIFYGLVYCPSCYSSSLRIVNEVLALADWIKRVQDAWAMVPALHSGIPCSRHKATWNYNWNQGILTPGIVFFVNKDQVCIACLEKNYPEILDDLKQSLEKAKPEAVKRAIQENKGRAETIATLSPLAVHATAKLR